MPIHIINGPAQIPGARAHRAHSITAAIAALFPLSHSTIHLFAGYDNPPRGHVLPRGWFAGPSHMLIVQVKFFGPSVALTGMSESRLEIAPDATLGEVAGVLAERWPRLGAMAGVRLAINRQYQALNYRLCDGDEIAVIPPVSGG